MTATTLQHRSTSTDQLAVGQQGAGRQGRLARAQDLGRTSSTLAEKLKDKGVSRVAHGGQDWQDATIFDGVVLGAGGAEFYKKAMIELDPERAGLGHHGQGVRPAAHDPGHVDPNFSGRDWNLAAAMVHQGRSRHADHGRLGQG